MTATETNNTKTPQGYEREAELAKAVADTRAALCERVELIREVQRKAGRRLLPGFKARLAAYAAARDAMREDIEAHPEKYEKPRTRALHGVKFGLRQLPGRLEIDVESAIPLIRKFFPDRYKALVKTTTRLQAAPLKALKPAELARIGGRIVELGDEVVIAIPKSPIDRLVEALLEDLDDESGEASDA